MAAVAPETNAINAQGDAQRQAAANLGTSRGGGAAAPAQQAEQLRTKAINDAIFGVRPQAAQQVAQIGGQQGQLSEEQLSNSLRALGLSSDVANEIVKNAIESRKVSFDQTKDITKQWQNLASAVSSGFKAGMAPAG